MTAQLTHQTPICHVECESFSQSYSRAKSLSYTAGIADFDSIVNFEKDRPKEDMNPNSNLEQTKLAIQSCKTNLDRIVSMLEVSPSWVNQGYDSKNILGLVMSCGCESMTDTQGVRCEQMSETIRHCHRYTNQTKPLQRWSVLSFNMEEYHEDTDIEDWDLYSSSSSSDNSTSSSLSFPSCTISSTTSTPSSSLVTSSSS